MGMFEASELTSFTGKTSGVTRLTAGRRQSELPPETGVAHGHVGKSCSDRCVLLEKEMLEQVLHKNVNLVPVPLLT